MIDREKMIALIAEVKQRKRDHLFNGDDQDITSLLVLIEKILCTVADICPECIGTGYMFKHGVSKRCIICGGEGKYID